MACLELISYFLKFRGMLREVMYRYFEGLPLTLVGCLERGRRQGAYQRGLGRDGSELSNEIL
jgi:hypothetical protein